MSLKVDESDASTVVICGSCGAAFVSNVRASAVFAGIAHEKQWHSAGLTPQQLAARRQQWKRAR